MARSECLLLAPTRGASCSAVRREDGSSHQSSWRVRVSDRMEPSNPCPQRCPVVGTSPKMEKGQSELLVPTGLAMSGRLDSNQRPPEPHSGGPGRESRKDRPFLNLRIPYFPYCTHSNPHFPQIPLSFLPFPTRGFCPVARLNPVGPRLGRFQARCPVCPRAVRCVGRWDEWHLLAGNAFGHLAFDLGARLGQPAVVIAPALFHARLVTVGAVGDPMGGDGLEQVVAQAQAACG